MPLQTYTLKYAANRASYEKADENNTRLREINAYEGTGMRKFE